MNKIFLFFISVYLTGGLIAQSYAPVPGETGSIAMHKDSSSFVGWASSVAVVRGPLNIQNPGLGSASYGVETDAVGKPDGTNVVSLGDGGEAIIQFSSPIFDGEGYDFAIFENGFQDDYIELGFVEVSSDGVNYFRFDGVSETPIDNQVTNFSFIDCRYIHNLAGKYRANYGTPFDLSELSGIPELNIQAITHVKIVDVIGSIDPSYGTNDSQGNIINDPYPTEFESGGFDLDGVGVIHSLDVGIKEKEKEKELFHLYPNPTSTWLTISTESECIINVTDLQGSTVLFKVVEGEERFNLSHLPSGVYFVVFSTENYRHTKKLIKK